MSQLNYFLDHEKHVASLRERLTRLSDTIARVSETETAEAEG